MLQKQSNFGTYCAHTQQLTGIPNASLRVQCCSSGKRMACVFRMGDVQSAWIQQRQQADAGRQVIKFSWNKVISMHNRKHRKYSYTASDSASYSCTPGIECRFA